MMARAMKNSLLFVKWFKKIVEQGKKNQFEGGGMSIFILHGLRDHIWLVLTSKLHDYSSIQ